LINDKKLSFDEYLSQMLKKDKVVLFLENFDDIMMFKQDNQNIIQDYEDVKESILHSIEKFEKKMC
jgi:hypothetical protein